MLFKIRSNWCFKLLIISVAAVAFLLGVPMSTFSDGFNLAFSEIAMLDEMAHASIFFVISLLFYGSFHIKRRVLMGIVIAIGGLTEVLQGAVGRSPSITDFLADSFGVLCAMTIVSIMLAFDVFRKN
jgi:hypothetical protein